MVVSLIRAIYFCVLNVLPFNQLLYKKLYNLYRFQCRFNQTRFTVAYCGMIPPKYVAPDFSRTFFGSHFPRKGRIIDGEEIAITEVPWQVLYCLQCSCFFFFFRFVKVELFRWLYSEENGLCAEVS